MSAPHSATKRLSTRLVQAAVLVLVFALVMGVTRFTAEPEGEVGLVVILGFFLLAGTLMSELFEPLGIPHLTGYLVAGIVAGPYVLQIAHHHAVERLTMVNSLALALIALEGGAELRADVLRKQFRSLLWSNVIQSVLVVVGIAVVFAALRPLVPFLQTMSLGPLVGVSLLWGVLASTRSPSAALGILSQTRASGPVATFTLTFVMASDIVVIVLLAAVMTVAKPLILPASVFSLEDFSRLGHELLGTIALGATLGLVLAAYLRLIGKQLVLVLLALGFGMTEVMHYLRYDPLLGFMVAGFVVQNLSKQGEKFINALHDMGSVVYVIFFAIAGAHLNLALLRSLWPAAVILAVSRACVTWGAGRIATRVANDPPAVKKWGWSGLVSQAGLALGLSSVIAQAFPQFGAEFRALAVATVALNELIGPILFKFALDRAGETSRAPEAVRPSLTPPVGTPPPQIRPNASMQAAPPIPPSHS